MGHVEPRGARAPRPAQALRRRLAALLVAPALLAALELAARFVPEHELATDAPMGSLVEEDPELGWRNRVGLRASVVGPSYRFPAFRYDVEINGDGWRGRALPAEGARAGRRIVILGDSFPWGWGVAVDEAFPQRLEALLADGSEVYDLGVPGYSTDQALLAFAGVAERLAPEVVVATVLLNDIHGNWESVNYGLRKPRLVAQGPGAWRFERPGWTTGAPSALATATRHSRLLARLRDWIGPSPGSPSTRGPELDAAALRALVEQPWNVYLPGEVEHCLGRLRAPDSVTRELLRRLAEVCRHVGARLVLLPVAHHHDQYLYSPAFAEPPGGTPSAFASAVVEVGGELGIEVLVVDGAMRAAVAAGHELNVGDGHLNAAGHRILAEQLRAFLRAR